MFNRPRKPRPRDFDLSKDVSYDYPDGLDLEPGSNLHERIINEVLDRAELSKRAISTRYDSWAEVDQKLTTYIWLDDEENKVLLDDSRKPVTVVVPTMFATLDVLMTYMTAAFLSDLLFRYSAVDSKDEVAALLMEQVIQNQVVRAKIGLAMNTNWRDALVYGFGASAVWFGKTMGTTSMVKRESAIGKMLKGAFGNSEVTRERVPKVVYEGNFVGSIDPYSYLPDPNVPVYEPQRGEYVGWVDRTNIMSLLSEERSSEGQMFNVRYLDYRSDNTSIYFGYDESGRADKSGLTFPGGEGITTPCDVVTMYIDLIPNDWGLGSSKYPEKWLFKVASDCVVIQAMPVSLDHGRFPVFVSCPDFDGHNLSPISRLETIFGLQTTVDWLFRSHVANVRKAVNDMIVYDPWIINTNDISNPGPGKLIRTRRATWGKDLRQSIVQLGINDITRSNVSDVAMIKNIMDESTGTIDAVKGLDRSGSERVSATEAGGRMKAALSRMERIAKIISMQAHADAGYLLASHTRQLMSESTSVRVYGNLAKALRVEYGTAVEVSPADIDVDLDVVPNDGSIPGAKDVSAWMQMLPVLLGDPVLRQQFDMVRVIKHTMRGMGASNTDEFENKQQQQMPINPQVMPQEQIDKNVTAGNLVPMGM